MLKLSIFGKFSPCLILISTNRTCTTRIRHPCLDEMHQDTCLDEMHQDTCLDEMHQDTCLDEMHQDTCLDEMS
jgi:hypothetical protein